MDYHSHKFQDFSLMVYENDELIALLPGNLVGNKLYSHQGLTYGGLIYAKDLKTKGFIQILKTILEFLAASKISDLIIKELPNIYLRNQINNAFGFVLFKVKADLVRVDLHSVVDIKYKAYSKGRKEGLKRANKHNLRIEESDTCKLFWHKILIPNLKAKHNVKPVHSLEEISLLKSKFKNNIRQFNVFYKEKIVAGTTIFETGQVAHCQYISGNEDKNKLGSLDFLHHFLIENVFQKKPYYDFGTSNINNGQQINEGLLFWKEGFGARSIPQGFYNIKTESYKLLEETLV